MWRQTACDSITKRKCVQISYDGYIRVVEVHAVGRTPKGNDVARVWQVRGGSESREYVGWKLLTLDEALGATILDESSHAPRQGYNRNDPAMEHFYGRI